MPWLARSALPIYPYHTVALGDKRSAIFALSSRLGPLCTLLPLLILLHPHTYKVHKASLCYE